MVQWNSPTENLVGTNWMENLRWANTEPSMHFRETNTDRSMHFRKANTNPCMHFRKANTEFLLPVLLPTVFRISLPSFLSLLLPVLIPGADALKTVKPKPGEMGS